MRIMKGRLGIRAISIVRQTADFSIQHPNNVRTEGLPSWVPDLANRNCFGLSTNGGLRSLEERHVCQNIFGQHVAASSYLSLTVNGSTLHLHAHSIGKVQKSSRALPNELDFTKCGNFVLSLIPLLNQLPAAYQGTNHTPIEALLHTLRLDIDPSTRKHARSAYNQTTFERYLVQALQLFVWSKSLSPHNQSVDQTMSWATHGPGHNPWKIPGLTPDFPMPHTLASRAELHQLRWLLLKNNNISDDIQELVIAQRCSCEAFRRAFGSRVAATKVFLVELNGENNTDSSQAYQQLSRANLLLGIGPDSIEGEEEVWAAAGTEWPFILERHSQGEAYDYKDGEEAVATTYRFKGEAFVRGIMHGELFERRAPEWQQIILK